MFRNPLAETIYKQKYSHGGSYTWQRLSDVLIDDITGTRGGKLDPLLSKEERAALADHHRKMKFIAGGRYLYYAGRPLLAINNCYLFSGQEDTREEWGSLLQRTSDSLMTGGGVGVDYSIFRPKGAKLARTGGLASGPIPLMHSVNEVGRNVMQGGSRRCLHEDSLITMSDGSKKPIKDVRAGEEVATRQGPRKVLAQAFSGIQPIIRIVTSKGELRCSEKHRWLTLDASRRKTWRVLAKNLSLNQKLYFHPAPKPCNEASPLSCEEAYLIGYYLGDGCAYSSGRSHEVTLQVASPSSNKEQVEYLCRVLCEQTNHEPHVRKGHGEVTEVAVSNKKAVELFQQYKKPHEPFSIPGKIKDASLKAKCAFLAGWFDADGYYGSDSWKVSNKHEKTRQELVRFLLDLGFESSECGTEVRLSSFQKSMWSALVLPFSFKKPKEKPSKAFSEIPVEILSVTRELAARTYDLQIEEVEEFIADDHVSHNSAIYASLNWKHGDAPDFLKAKNWDEMPIGKAKKLDGTPYTYKDAKEDNFNFPAPLDMTNISLNYDDAWLNLPDRHLHPTFLENTRQALRTAEPGWSFNFGEKQDETLRNACTEVTSEDDSDVCNLASANMSQIDTIEEFAEVVYLASKFLYCGTIRGDVPFEKVRKIRDQNRRLGLGLMGIHEWLLKRGYPYEVVPELHQWLEVYRRESERGANEVADAFGLPRPKAYRAIAPTGSIGLIAKKLAA